jgi:hypothetical protein
MISTPMWVAQGALRAGVREVYFGGHIRRGSVKELKEGDCNAKKPAKGVAHEVA